jgi:hypothetical protein
VHRIQNPPGSVTVIGKEHVLCSPDASVAVALTVVVPTPKSDPDGTEYEIVGEPQLSNPTAAAYETAVKQVGLVDVETGPGQVIVGFSASKTVTFCVQTFVFPLPSVTVQVTAVWPFGNVVGALLTVVFTLQLSLVVGVPSVTLLVLHFPRSV